MVREEMYIDELCNALDEYANEDESVKESAFTRIMAAIDCISVIRGMEYYGKGFSEGVKFMTSDDDLDEDYD